MSFRQRRHKHPPRSATLNSEVPSIRVRDCICFWGLLFVLRAHFEAVGRAQEIQAATQVCPRDNCGRLVVIPLYSLRARPAAVGHVDIAAYDGRAQR